MTLFAVAISVALLIVLVSAIKLNPFLAFIVTSILAGTLLNLPLERISGVIEAGIGNMLGPIAIVICVGAMFGKVIADSGAAKRIADTLINSFGARNIGVAMALAGFVVGIPLFYNVGFVLLVPLIFSITYRANLPVVATALPMLAGLSVAHGFLPPHPSPTALVAQFDADVGRTLVYGLIVAIPTLLVAGPVFATTTRRIIADPPPLFRHEPSSQAATEPGALASFCCALLPVIMLASATLVSADTGIMALLGNANVVMLLALFVATVTLGLRRGQTLRQIGAGQGEAIRDVAGIVLIIGGAGALKQIFVEGQADTVLASLMASLALPPLFLGWLTAFVIRVALGSATVAGLTAAGIVHPLVTGHGADPNLMVLAIGAGSLMCSHVNDSGFWMFKEYIGLSVADTFRSWTIMESLVGIFGLLFTLLLSLMI